jgi:hypothetical protein
MGHDSVEIFLVIGNYIVFCCEIIWKARMISCDVEIIVASVFCNLCIVRCVCRFLLLVYETVRVLLRFICPFRHCRSSWFCSVWYLIGLFSLLRVSEQTLSPDNYVGHVEDHT